MKQLILSLGLLTLVALSSQASEAIITEEPQSVLTYPYAEPTPVAMLTPQSTRPSYPYNRWDIYTLKGEYRDWNVVTLENDYIRVTMLPQMGGKVWGAMEKSSGREFLYTNHVIKFSDIAMRGAWTSGGLEFNFGILGHVPTTATPVDYVTTKKADGSVSCYIASYEWITDAWWMVEINLRPDRAYFTTSVTWYNGSGNYQSQYQWMNAAYTIKGDAEFVYPGNASIGHDGLWDSYPVTREGKNISWYKDVNFGGDVSVHVLGEYNHFYGIYWHEWDFGSAHYANHSDKLGQKYFIWSKARSGAIWENLLTDNDGQYIEQQSGRMFCQPLESCAQTPFQHTALVPGETETWTEYWFPIKDIKGIKQTSPIGSFNYERNGDVLHLMFSPLCEVNTTMYLYDGDTLVYSCPVQAGVLQKWEQHYQIAAGLLSEGRMRVVIGNQELVYSEIKEEKETNRPLEFPQDFNWESAYAHAILGQNAANQKNLMKAEEELKQCLAIEPYYLPAINTLAQVYNVQGRFSESEALCLKGLSINTYDADCNYQYAIASEGLGRTVHAQDGYSMAARSVKLRAESNICLARIELQKSLYTNANEWINRALEANPLSPVAQHMQVVIARQSGKEDEAKQLAQQYLQTLPLYQPLRFELYRLGLMDQTTFQSGMKQELQVDLYIQLADEYERMGLLDDALAVYAIAPQSPMIAYRKAYIYHQKQNEQEASAELHRALTLSPECVFPHRLSTLKVLRYAESILPCWQNHYYMGLIYLATQQLDLARKEWHLCDDATFAPLFLSLARIETGDEQLQAILKAQTLDKTWRSKLALMTYYTNHNQANESVKAGKKLHSAYPTNYLVGLAYAKALLATKQYTDCLNVLKTIQVVPYEGSKEGRKVYYEAYLGLAHDLMKKGKYEDALDALEQSRLWPENLGVGKPYEELIDHSQDNALEEEIKSKMRK